MVQEQCEYTQCHVITNLQRIKVDFRMCLYVHSFKDSVQSGERKEERLVLTWVLLAALLVSNSSCLDPHPQLTRLTRFCFCCDVISLWLAAFEEDVLRHR